MTFVLTTADDRIDLYNHLYFDINGVAGPGTASGLSFDGSSGNDTIASDHGYGSYFKLTGNADGVITLTSSSGSTKFSNFEKITWYGGVTINLGTAGDDVITGGAKDDKFLFGLAGHDTILGRAGADWIGGGADQDFLNGGKGADQFVYTALSDSGPTTETHDIIQGFKSGQDKINLHAVGQPVKFIKAKPFHHVTGELHAIHSGGITLVQWDTNGDAVADFEIQLNGLKTLTKADFIL